MTCLSAPLNVMPTLKYRYGIYGPKSLPIITDYSVCTAILLTVGTIPELPKRQAYPTYRFVTWPLNTNGKSGHVPMTPIGYAGKTRPDRKSTRLNSSHLGISYA